MMPQPDYIACSGITPEVRTEKTAPKSSLMMILIVFAQFALLGTYSCCADRTLPACYAGEEENSKWLS